MNSSEECRVEYEKILPRIETHAKIQFRMIFCPSTRDELIAEAVALSWKWWVVLWNRGKDPRTFVYAIAGFAVRAARCGRRVCGQENTKDVLSPLAQRRHDFRVKRIPLRLDEAFADALRDNTQTPVDEQVAFRIDFPAWLATNDERRRRLIERMAHGDRTMDLADLFGVTAGRVSQLRAEFFLSWNLFQE